MNEPNFGLMGIALESQRARNNNVSLQVELRCESLYTKKRRVYGESMIGSSDVLGQYYKQRDFLFRKLAAGVRYSSEK